MDYFQKITQKPGDDLAWNIPEKKQGTVNVIGGNNQNFKTEIKTAEFLSEKYPIEKVIAVLPDSLKKNLPPLPIFKYLSSTDTGSFANGNELRDVINSADYNIMLGDFSKNNITKEAISSAFLNSETKINKPVLITRDAVDLIAEQINEQFLLNDNLIIFASMPQMIKLLRAVYYPKVLLLSQSLVQVTETLHKFTLSYPVGIITLHNENILIAHNGEVKAIAIYDSGYSPINIWQGELAAKITTFNLYNPNNFIKATISAVFS